MAKAPDPRVSIEPLPRGEVETAAGMLARAFRDNPLNRAVIGSDDPARRDGCNLHGMRALLPIALQHARVLTAHVTGRLAGALIAAPPYGYPLPPPPWRLRLRCLLGQGWRVGHRWGQVFQELDALHPLEPMAYLATLGIEPFLQGRGVGTALLSAWVAELDRDGHGAYLETDAAATVAFYQRAGFRVVGQCQVFGAPIWRMRREPETH
jgi:ribosomal protein S18 acetylase RimI-like enzyme